MCLTNITFSQIVRIYNCKYLVHEAIVKKKLNEQFQLDVNKRINLKMASDRKSMAEAKVGLQCEKLQKEGRLASLQAFHIEERSRGRGKTAQIADSLHWANVGNLR